MPLTATFTEEMVRGIAPDEGTFKQGSEIAHAGRFKNLGVSNDGSWLFGEVQGSGREPYQVSADFHDPANPVLRSSSPSRTMPDKFSVGLLLSYLNNPNSFENREPSEDLLIKRDKKIAMDEKKKSGSAAPRKAGKVSADKKLAAQRDGLDILERFLVELVAAGQWFKPDHVEKIEKRSKQISDAFLPAATFGLRRLMLIAKQKDLSEDEKMAAGAIVVGSLWDAVSKTRALLDQKPPADEAIADAITEDLIGRAWQLPELREKGYFHSDLSLLELAFERIDDESRQQRLEVSNLLDLNTGAVHQAIAYRPFKGLNQIPEQPSYQSPLSIPEAAVCPGFVNRRLRWEKGTEHLVENPPSDLFAKASALGKKNFNEVLEAFRLQLATPLAPREAVFLLSGERIGRVGERTVIQDGESNRIEMKDRRKDYSNVANLVRAIGMMGKDKPALLVRFYLQPLTNTVFGLPLAALSPKHHLRLGV